MTVSPTIRQITDFEQDWPKVETLLQRLDEHHRAILGGELNSEHNDRLRKFFEKGVTRGRARVLLAEADGGTPVGLATGLVLKNSWIKKEKVGFLDNFYVDERLRGSTLILRLHREIEDWFRAEGVQFMERTVVYENERSRKLWYRMGFEPYMETLRKPLKP